MRPARLLKTSILAFVLPAGLGVVTAAGWIAPQSVSQETSPSQARNAAGQDYYANAKPYLDDLNRIRSFPELQGLRLADSQEQLLPILDKVGEQLAAMVQKIPDLVSREVVTQVQHSGTTGAIVPLSQQYSYLILAHRSNAAVTLEEYRTDLPGKHPKPPGKGRAYPLTHGFALTWSRFYPSNWSESRFRYLGEQKTEGRKTFVVAFAQKPGAVKFPSEILIGGARIPVLDQGIAWIDQSDYRILRLRLDMLAPRPDINLQGLTTEIHFGEARIPQLQTPLWLPQRVEVFIVSNGMLFENVHRYSDYRLFTVKSRILPTPP